MIKTMCSFVSKRETNLTESFREKYPNYKNIRVQQFCEALSSLESDNDINFNYLKLMEEGKEDVIFSLVKGYLDSEYKQASKERLIPPEFTETKKDIRTMSDVVTYSGEKFIAANPNKTMTAEAVKKVVNSYIAMYNIPAITAGKMRKNIQTLSELRTFALYLAEAKRFNSFESDSNKASESQMANFAIGKLNDFAKINEGLREIKASRVEVEEDNTPKKTILQHSNMYGNRFFTSNPIEGVHTANQAYIVRRQTNIDNTDATIMVSQWAKTSPSELGTMGDANKAGKLAGNLTSKFTSIKDFVDEVIENLEARKDLNLEDGVSLNITGNTIDRIVKYKNNNQDTTNKLIYQILKELQSRGIKINQVVTGGQTGVDEAGIIAAAALGIPYMVRAAAFEYVDDETGKSITVYPLREEEDKDTWYRPNQMGKYMDRFNKEAVERVKGDIKAPKEINISSSPFILPSNSKIHKAESDWVRGKAKRDTKTLYIFTDNTDRDSGSNVIDPNSKYAQKYGEGKHFPNQTTATLRGLDNAMPVSTQRWYHGDKKGENGRWTDSDIKEFEKTIDEEFDAIIKEWNTGKYDSIQIPSNDGFFNSKISNISESRTPELYKALQKRVNKLIKAVDGVDTSNQPQSSRPVGKPVAELAEVNQGVSSSNWAGNSGYFAQTDSSFNPYANASQEEADNAQNLDAEKSQEQDAKVKEETSRIKSSITVKEDSPIALLHRAIGKNAPQIIKARMDMFSHLFSNKLTGLVAKYIAEQQDILDDDNSTAYQKDVAQDNINKASDPNDGRGFVLSVAGSRVLQEMKEEFERNLKVLDVLLQSGGIDFDTYKYRKGQWQIVLDHFDTLFSLAKVLIERNEGVKVTNSSQGLKVSESSEKSEFDENNHDDNDEGKIAYGNDGWGFKNRESDPHTRMSQAVKAVLRDIVKTRIGEKNITIDTDDLGQTTYYNEDELYAVLVREFSKMKEPLDFCRKVEGEFYDNGNPVYDFPIFDGMAAKYPWVSELLRIFDDELENTQGTQLVSLFYANFRNDFIPYYMNIGGKSNSLNTESASQSVLNMATTNYEHGIVLSDHSIYTAVSKIDKKNVAYWLEQEDLGNNKKGLDRINQLTRFINKYNKLSQSNPEDLKSIVNTCNEIADLFKSIGLSYSGAEMKTFMDTELGRGLLKDAIANAYAIISGVNKANDDINITDDKSFISNYKAIGKALDKVYTEYVQQSFREGDKTRYSYSTPNYIDTITKFLNESNLEKRREYMLDHYGKTEWFYKDGVWRNEVLQRLWDGEKVAFSDLKDMPIIQTKEADDRTKHEYEDWTPNDINSAFLAEYYQNNESSSSIEVRTSAFYNFPIFSDSPICKLVKMRRYIGNGSTDYTSTFKSELLDKFVTVAEQELWRMQLVRNRKGIDKDKKIVNFDISDDWKSRGNQFCFFPYLNKMSINEIVDNLNNDKFTITLENEKLRNKLDSLVKTNNPDLDFSELADVDKEELMKEEYKRFILSSIRTLINKYPSEEHLGKTDKFTDFIEYAILDKNDFLKQELLKLGIEQSMNKSLEKYLSSYENIQGLTTGINNLLVNHKLEQKEGYLNIIDAYRNEIEEYFWNSCFATANIIQLTTTDLAYYKNAVDFQKRYKEVYASGTKLNTQSKYGKEIETTLYLRDNFMTVPTYTYLKKSLENAVSKGDLHKTEMKAILSNYRNICQTDAQAFRSVKSVRDVLDMLGQLTPAMDEMFNRMLSGNYEYKYSDFDMIIQTIKPFFFGHDTVKDNISEAGLLMVPHQNKNSEFTLLSSLGVIAGIMNNAPQLVALNNYMIANDIDVVQFESAVKVGGQGIVDINWSNAKVLEAINESKESETLHGYNISKYIQDKRNQQSEEERKENPWNIQSGEDIKDILDDLLENDVINSEKYNELINNYIPNYEETIEILEASVKNPDGSIKKEVVHQHSYGDYMIATATPEHFFDAEAIYGSQFRNIIISDIDKNTEYVVNGQTYKGKELKEHYRKLVTEQLLDSFRKVRNEFSDIRTLQAKLKSLTAGNPRYDDDLLDALELVKDPETNKLVFNIPLHNPSTTGKIQELLDSLWKSNVTKQHIKGGAGILVSDFGFSNTLQVVRDENGAIKEIECYLPAYAEVFYKEFMNADGTIRFAEIEDKYPELLKVVGTRIPTEGKYSMLNLRVKGFLPRMNGGAVMLPAEITQTAGSDFKQYWSL